MLLTPETQVHLNKFKPRQYQKCLFDAILNMGYKKILAVWPRRSGKDMCAWNICIQELIRKTQCIYYVFPTFALGRRILWDALTIDGYRMLDYMPAEVIESKNEVLMRIRLKNGSLFQVVGSDKFDKSMIGSNAHGMVFSEFAVSNPMSYSLSLPILNTSDGWALIVSTPRGKNFMWEMYNVALNNPEHWYVSKLTVDDTNHVSLAKLEQDRITGQMSEDLQLQEYWTSFEMGVEGAYYTRYIDKLRLKGQIGVVPWEPAIKVHTAWDIGYRDMTSIIFFQVCGQVIRIIDCYENNKKGLEHYVNVLKSKDYTYGKHVAGHDIINHEFTSGITRWRKAKDLGIMFILRQKEEPMINVVDGIEAVRSKLPLMWFDQIMCAPLIKALENYRQEYDPKKRIYKDKPLHDIFSNFADAMRYLCVNLNKFRDGVSAEELDARYRKAMYGEEDNIPPIFRDNIRRF